MADGITPTLALRSAKGVEVWKQDGKQQQQKFIPDTNFVPDQSKVCRAIVYSPNGRFLAWANGSTVRICTANDWKVIASLSRPKACFLQFSPGSTFLMTWEVYTENPKETPKEKPNLFVYRAETGEEVYSVIQKRHQEWQIHWSSDESLAALLVGGEVLLFEVNGESAFEKPVKRLGGLRNGGLSVASGPSPPHIAMYTPGTKGAPSICRLFKYPNCESNQQVSSKSFFQADKVDMMWNKKGTGLILMTSTEVDQSGVSYYGKQALHYMNSKGDSCAIQLKAEGPIHAVAWSPKSTEFCVVYGFMPSKASLFNLKCDIIYDFEPGHRNSIYYNDFGNLLLLGGFGNLPGYIETWDLVRKKKIAGFKAADTTLLEWSPTGDKFVSATTAPRLRMSNGFKIWHYSGALLGEYEWSGELLEVVWQKYAPGTFKEKPITDEKVAGIVSTTPQASKQKYVPPGARNSVGAGGNETGGATIDMRPLIPGLPPGYRSSAQTKGKKNKKKTADGSTADTKTGKKTPNGTTASNSTVTSITDANDENEKTNQKETPAAEPKKLTPDQEKDKQIKRINKKLKGIQELKEKNERGEKLVETQIIKMNSETELIKQLNALKAS